MDGLTALLVLSAMAGLVHVLAPDHWFPASTLACRRRWRGGKTFSFLCLAYAGHLVLGYLIFLLLSQSELLLNWVAARLLLFTVGLIGAAALVRSLRFSQVEGVMRSSSLSRWRIWTALSLLGPCESVIPILIKGHQLGMNPFGILIPFFAATFLAGAVLVFGSLRIWDKPEALARWVGILQGRTAPLPVAGVVAVALVYFMKLS